ncbi:hypothetical protein EW146_g6469 [Bondarzewia mesenterica]|uniref:Uncharacterized protein n=1 Tax=Bondarzewia mesenterica TaxID=1095465 RepID=A0A4S4LU64_9AGAM|nr:hypothetical protein EW146_g6469 [Bondarzewia mesenterica]
MSLTVNHLYAALYRRHDERYHWALITATSATEGVKSHATNIPNPADWHYVSEPFNVATEWKPLVILASLGELPADVTAATLQERFARIPMQTPECDQPHPFTCRIWFRAAVKALEGVVPCANFVDALERELVSLADDHATLVGLGRPWKLYAEVSHPNAWTV